MHVIAGQDLFYHIFLDQTVLNELSQFILRVKIIIRLIENIIVVEINCYISLHFVTLITQMAPPTRNTIQHVAALQPPNT